ncbi:MAG TPA: SMC-Scp complex subunit ScpB [Pyrinomonadaceae bacterium]|jgi:segregation and condensation protein B
MSKRRSKQSLGEPAAPADAFLSADDAAADSREDAVEELDEALDALPGGGDDAAGADDDGGNPLGRIDVGGETSFDSAEFEEDDEEADADDEDDEGDADLDEEAAEAADVDEDAAEAVEEDEAEAVDGDEDDEDDEDDAEGVDDDDGLTDDEASDDEKAEYAVFDADAEDRAEELERMRAQMTAVAAEAGVEVVADDDEVAPGGKPRELAELVAICEALIFVSEDPLPAKAMADILNEDKGWVQVAVEELAKEFNERNGGLMLREVAGGWQFATRPEHHEHVRAYLKSKPSAKLSLAALETLAVIAYKQPVTVPEILEIRGVQSSSAIKTLLDKRLIVAKGRKETVGRPMMYGTSKDFLLQFGLRDLSELPNVEDFEDLAGGGEA